MKMEQTECSETLAYKIQMPGNYPEESIQLSGNIVSRGFRLLNNVFSCLFFLSSKHVVSFLKFGYTMKILRMNVWYAVQQGTGFIETELHVGSAACSQNE
jgi:hypothetical protein